MLWGLEIFLIDMTMRLDCLYAEGKVLAMRIMIMIYDFLKSPFRAFSGICLGFAGVGLECSFCRFCFVFSSFPRLFFKKII